MQAKITLANQEVVTLELYPEEREDGGKFCFPRQKRLL